MAVNVRPVSEPCCAVPRAAAGELGGPLLDVIEETLGQLLAQQLEEATFQALQANLEPPAGCGGGDAGARYHQPDVAAERERAMASERCTLLNILLLIYYHPRKQCAPDRFLSLARLFHTRLFTTAGGAAAVADGGEEPTQAQLSIKLVRGVGVCVSCVLQLSSCCLMMITMLLSLMPSHFCCLRPRPHLGLRGAGHTAAPGGVGCRQRAERSCDG